MPFPDRRPLITSTRYVTERNLKLPQIGDELDSAPAVNDLFEMPLSNQSWRFAKSANLSIATASRKRVVRTSVMSNAVSAAGGFAKRLRGFAASQWDRFRGRGSKPEPDVDVSTSVSPKSRRSPRAQDSSAEPEEYDPLSDETEADKLTVRCKRCGEGIRSDVDAIEEHHKSCTGMQSSVEEPNAQPPAQRQVHVILPEVYHNLRTFFGISSKAFLHSLGLRGVLQSVLSGHFANLAGRASPHRDLESVFTSMDGRFFCQLLNEGQSERLMSFIEPYYNYVRRHPDTHLFRIVGHFRILEAPPETGSTDNLKDFSFVVFQNPANHSLPASAQAQAQSEDPSTTREQQLELVRRYEIAGSAAHPIIERRRGRGDSRIAPVGDLLDFVMEQVHCCVGSRHADVAVAIANDLAFLEAQRFIDYSLLVTVAETAPGSYWDKVNSMLCYLCYLRQLDVVHTILVFVCVCVRFAVRRKSRLGREKQGRGGSSTCSLERRK